MATYEYNCNACEYSVDVYKPIAALNRKEHCERCNGKMVRILRSPAGGAHFDRTWNEKANDMRRDPYTQAKAQADAVYNEQNDLGKHPEKTSEEGLQIAAKAIDKGNNKVDN